MATNWHATLRQLALILCVQALVGLSLVIVGATNAAAVEAIVLGPELEMIEIGARGELVEARGDNIQIQTAAGSDGVKGRMAVRSAAPGTNPNWLIFALTNPTDQPIERWLAIERYNLIGSGIVWPDLDHKRIEAVTPSIGFLPERVQSDRADIFRISLEPRQTVTYAVELASDRYPRATLWAPLVYELRARDRQLFNGIMLGITGVLGIFLTAVFAANHKSIFPCAALVTWCVLAYLCVDFGFWHKLLHLRAEDNAVYRAATESAMAASFVIFLNVFLRLGAWHGFIRMLLGVWIVAQLSLVAIAVIDPRLASTFARASFAGIAGLGMLLILFLTLRRQDRALALLPTWILFMVWVFAASMILTGQLNGAIVVSSLAAGLVLVVVLIGFAVTQFAFRSIDTMDTVTPNEQQLRSLAIEGSGAAVWEWNARRQEIKTSSIIDVGLGLIPGSLTAKVDDFLSHMFEPDRERFRLMLWSAQERGGGELMMKFRMRHADGSYRWFDLEAAAIPTADRRSLRCVGLMRDITEARRAHEALMHDAVHDNLTGLPNRELFLDRATQSILQGTTSGKIGQTILFVDIDKFKSANSSFGLTVGDSLLLTVAKRLDKNLGPHDTLGRVSGDQFAILFVDPQEPTELAMRAERIRRSLRAPVRITGQDVVLTASIGVASNDGTSKDGAALLADAELAMYRAKRHGADKVEIFQPEFRNDVDDRVAVESDLRRAIERKEIKVLYQPIIYLATEELAGFEALVRWQHPRRGLLSPIDFIPVAEQSDLIIKLGSYVLNRAVQDAAVWHKELPRSERQLFVSVNVSSRQLLRPELIQEVRQIIGRQVVPPSSIRLEITESLVMENPEQAAEAMEILKSTGAGIAIDDFGTGYSSLSYLQRFPVDTLKIDRDLIQSSHEGPGSAIVRSIVALSHELGKKVVAEGVEESQDVGFLRSIGCEYAQGFYYGGAMSMNDVLRFLRMVSRSERKLQRRGFFTVGTRKRSRTQTTVPPAKPRPRPASDEQSIAAKQQPVAQRPANGQPYGERPVTVPTAGLLRTRQKDSPVERAAQRFAEQRGIGSASPRTFGAPPPLPHSATPNNAPSTRPPAMPAGRHPVPSNPTVHMQTFPNGTAANAQAARDPTAEAVGSLAKVLASAGKPHTGSRTGAPIVPVTPLPGTPPHVPNVTARTTPENDVADVVSDLGRALADDEKSNTGSQSPLDRLRSRHEKASVQQAARLGPTNSATGPSGPASGNGAGQPTPKSKTHSRLTTLPPALARSLEKLAGDKDGN